MVKTYHSEASSVIHDLAESLYRHNIIDKMAIQEFDESCLIFTPELNTEDIRDTREREKLFQA